MIDENLPPAVARVEEAVRNAGIKTKIVKTEESARSAAEAAKAVGAKVSQIVKSLIFEGVETGSPVLFLVSGANRVDLDAAAELAGEKLRKPDADFVKARTGFSIGGVAPLGASEPIRTVMDEDLFNEPTLWAAAGSPVHVFEVVPLQLRSATGARVGRLKASE